MRSFCANSSLPSSSYFAARSFASRCSVSAIVSAIKGKSRSELIENLAKDLACRWPSVRTKSALRPRLAHRPERRLELVLRSRTDDLQLDPE